MRYTTISALLIAVASPVWAGDSPQFRGQGGLGVSADKGVPTEWNEKQNIRWKIDLPGRGLSSPVIVGDRLYMTACTGVQQNRLHVLCMDVNSGKKLWHRQVWATGTTQCHSKTCMAAPTPVTDGKFIYCLFASFDLVCFDRDGNMRWFRSLTGDYETVGNNVGMASSPLLWRDLLILAVENVGESFALAIDKHTGENRWKVERHRRINWVTPLIYKNGDQDEVVFQSITDITGYYPATGKKRWSVKRKMSTIPTPVFGGGMIFAAGSKFVALRPGAKGRDAEVVWEGKLSTGYASPTYHNGLLYTLSNRGALVCTDAATGRKVWAKRVQGTFAASPLIVDGRLYLVSEDGATTVLKAGPEPEVLGVNRLSDTFLATPVAANGSLFLRSDERLYCVGGQKK